MKRLSLVLLLILTIPPAVSAEADKVPGPSFRDTIGLKSVGSPVISPNGEQILFTVRQVDWGKNGYDSEIWLSRNGTTPFQLTRTSTGSSGSPAWSPNGRWISFIASRDKGRQIYLINPSGGEAFKITNHKEGINSYRWASDGKQIAFTSTEPLNDKFKSREELYGRYEVEDAEYRLTHLWIVAVTPGKINKAKRLTEGDKFTVSGFRWSPDGSRLAFDHRPDPLINSYAKTDISILSINSGEISPLVTQSGSDSGPRWSPDGKWILFSTKMGDDRYYTNGNLARIPAAGGQIEVLTESFDENPSVIEWTDKGIYMAASERVFRRVYLLDPVTRKISKIKGTPENIGTISLADDNNTITFSAYDRTTVSEI